MLESNWTGLQHAFECVPARSVLSPDFRGELSVKDVIGLIAVWDDVASRNIHAISHNEPLVHIRDSDSFERREVEVRAEWSITQLIAEMNQNHDRLLATLEEASRTTDDELGRIEETIGHSTWEHYDRCQRLIDASFPLT